MSASTADGIALETGLNTALHSVMTSTATVWKRNSTGAQTGPLGAGSPARPRACKRAASASIPAWMARASARTSAWIYEATASTASVTLGTKLCW